MLEMIFGHKQFFECEPRLYARLHYHYVHIGDESGLMDREIWQNRNATPSHFDLIV